MIKENIKFLTFLAIFGLIGGYFTALYSIEIMDKALLDETIAQVGSIEIVIAITTLQSLIYAVILGLIGKIIAEKIGLWRKITFESKPLICTAVASLIGGAIFILADVFVFARLIPAVMDSYASKPTISYIIASIIYGGYASTVLYVAYRLCYFKAFKGYSCNRHSFYYCKYTCCFSLCGRAYSCNRSVDWHKSHNPYQMLPYERRFRYALW